MWKSRTCFIASTLGLAIMLIVFLFPVSDPVTAIKILALACFIVTFAQIADLGHARILIADMIRRIDMNAQQSESDQDDTES